MLSLHSIAELEARAQQIGLTLRILAAKSGIAASTLYRLKAEKTEPSVKTLRKAEAALVAEELAIRDHLLRLHPVSIEELARQGYVGSGNGRAPDKAPLLDMMRAPA